VPDTDTLTDGREEVMPIVLSAPIPLAWRGRIGANAWPGAGDALRRPSRHCVESLA